MPEQVQLEYFICPVGMPLFTPPYSMQDDAECVVNRVVAFVANVISNEMVFVTSANAAAESIAYRRKATVEGYATISG